MITLRNNLLEASINPKGAELTTLTLLATGRNYMWNGDPAFWGKFSPVLFPIVGTLKDNTYHYKGKAYQLPRHGFARDRNFELSEKTADRAVFLLTDDAASRENYPFAFRFSLIYELKERELQVTYRVVNPADLPLFFSVGAHPAFAVPLEEGASYSDYVLEFELAETAGRWPISPDGLIEKHPIPLMDHSSRLPISRELFSKDALVFKGLRSGWIRLVSEKYTAGWTFRYSGFPYMGIWAAKGADFVCIEPWCGIADPVSSDQEFTRKEGIHELAAGAVFERSWSIAPH